MATKVRLRIRMLTCAMTMIAAAVSAAAAAAGEQAAGAEVAHPLDALSASEIETATAVLRSAGYLPEGAQVASLTVLEPAKEQVLDHHRLRPLPRRALATVRAGRRSHELVVNLGSRRVESAKGAAGQLPISSAESEMAERLVRADPRWQAAMRRRGLQDSDTIHCIALSPGYFGEPGAERRLVKLPCFKATGATTNLYDRPIEGVVATVDLDQGAVLEVIDSGTAPVSSRIYDLKAPQPGAGSGEQRSQPGAGARGRTFRQGSSVQWGPWSFHLRADSRVGPVLSLVSFRDAARQRLVLYQAHLSELFVPYMADDPAWYFRAYMDVGEYGVGAVSQLEPGIDCPADADFIAITLADEQGKASRQDKAMCLFERGGAMPAWRRREFLTGAFAGSAGKELVLRSAPAVANYDYLIDWIFLPTGEIRVEVGATGVMAVKGVEARTAAGANLSEGALVAPQLLAVNHDHLFSFRFDLDVDGSRNDFVIDRLTPERASGSTPRRSLWRVRSETVAKEGGFKRQGGPTRWRFVNPGVRTSLGYAPGYEIVPGETATSLLSDEDWPQRRAAFSGSTLWVTRHKPNELFAGGTYPTQSRQDLGLTAFSDGEGARNADLVAWYTMGLHHGTRPEDWPIVSTMRRSVTLRPSAFFDSNPAVPVAEGQGK